MKKNYKCDHINQRIYNLGFIFKNPQKLQAAQNHLIKCEEVINFQKNRTVILVIAINSITVSLLHNIME